jgi:hypothetical protein
MTSLAQVGFVLAGRELGGGLRKLDLADVNELLLPVAEIPEEALRRVDDLVRCGLWDRARLMADEFVLRRTLDWPRSLVQQLQRLASDLILGAEKSRPIARSRKYAVEK